MSEKEWILGHCVYHYIAHILECFVEILQHLPVEDVGDVPGQPPVLPGPVLGIKQSICVQHAGAVGV